jgi:uncharacterized phiE125 gp8 family phage protein
MLTMPRMLLAGASIAVMGARGADELPDSVVRRKDSLISRSLTSVPVSLAEAKLHLKVEAADTDEDALITGMIGAALAEAEHETGMAFGVQTRELVMDRWPGPEVRLGCGPLLRVISVRYTDPTGTTHSLPLSSLGIDPDHTPPILMTRYGMQWPATIEGGSRAVRIRYVCGMTGQIPDAVSSWILLQVGALYRNRESFSAGVTVQALPNRFVDALLDPWRTYGRWWS